MFYRVFIVLLISQWCIFFANGQKKKVNYAVPITDTIIKEPKEPHSPHKAALYSALLPGLGQIYNRAYWKLPIIYGGIGAFIYAYTFNTQKYRYYRTIYVSMVDNDPATDYRWKDLGYPEENFDQLKTQVQELTDYFQTNQERTMYWAAVFYVAIIIDAVVEAHLWSFNVSDNLSMKAVPNLYVDPYNQTFHGGVGLRFTIK